MDEERNSEASAEAAERETSQEKQETAGGDDVASEINRLVEAMAGAVSGAWNSNQRYQLEADLRGCLATLVDNLEEALNRFGRSEQGQELQDQAARVATRVRESALAAELRDGLVHGLRTAADEVQRFAGNFEEQEAEADSSQDIAVEADQEEPDKDQDNKAP